MKISVNDEEIFTLSDTKKRVIKNDILSDEFESDMKRRLQYIIMHKYEQCFKRLKEEWDKKLSDRFSSIPTNPDEYANLVFSQQDYKNRSQREGKAQ